MMMSSSSSSKQQQAAAEAVGGKAARACDSCLRRRARWYCAADDAFLCQGCDASVHSANPLARRHERLRLRPRPNPTPPPLELEPGGVASTSSSKKKQQQRQSQTQQQVAPAAWSKRKARTRRPHLKSVGQLLLSRKLVVVPEVSTTVDSSSEEQKAEEEEEEQEEQLLYCVPTFDRALAELCSPPPVVVVDDVPTAAATCTASSSCRDENNTKPQQAPVVVAESPVQQLPDCSFAGCGGGFGLGPTDAELREFAADMEALLGQGLGGDGSNELDDSLFYMESLGLMTPPERDQEDVVGRGVKMDPDGASVISRSRSNNGGVPGRFGPDAELMKPEASSAMMDVDFNYSSSPTVMMDMDNEDDEDSYFEQKASASNAAAAAGTRLFLKRSLDLSLDYEAIIESWGSSPWTDGQRPADVQLDDFWPHAHLSGWMGAGGGRLGGEAVTMTPRLGMGGGGREARVTRYREKRRTRLFAKKIRYEVRKLNAEKRPRMKGRFVKRPAAAAAAGGGGAGAAIAAAPCAVT